MNEKSKSPGTVFVSYAREDHDRVKPLVEFLDKRFVVWWDEDIEPGAPFRPTIDKVLAEAACVVVVWTSISVRKEFVCSEAEKGHRRGVMVPVLFDTAAGPNIPVGFTELHYADLTFWNGAEDRGMQRLISSIQGLVERGPAPSSYYAPLAQDQWAINNSLNATSELRRLTVHFRSIGETLLPGSAPAADLIGALSEVHKTYQVVDRAIMKFIAPAVAKRSIPIKPFVNMERGTLVTTIKRGRGHCTQILVYYRKYGGLRDWLQQKLDLDELARTDEIFDRLGTSDFDLFDALVEIGNVLTQESRAIVNLLVADQEDAARTRILAGRDKLEPLERQLADAMNELQEVAGSLGYIEKAG